jgi:hypothetical protein
MRYWLKLIGIPSLVLVTLIGAGYLAFGRTIFHIDHPPCFGTCPVYSVWIFHDGTILYHGQHNVRSTGLRIGHMDAVQVQQFAAAYGALLDRLPPIPPTSLIVFDTSTRSIGLTQYGQTRGVMVDDTDGPRVPLVDTFIEQIETAAQIPQWTRATRGH